MNFQGNKVIVAPMAEITDSVFRKICKEFGADIVYSEMISAEGLIYGSQATYELAEFNETERPIGIQLFGADSESLSRASEIIENKFEPDFIDLNCGCPVQKVIKKNGGAALLKDIDNFMKILRSIISAVSIPVTVKLRSGWQKYQWVDIEYALAAQDCGVAAITLHPRSQTMVFSGHSFWERIRLVKETVSIPVIGNGDIETAQDALRMVNETGCDSVMVGRASFGNPFILKQIKAVFSGKPVPKIKNSQKIETALVHLNRYKEKYGELRALKDMKKHLVKYLKGIDGASKRRNLLSRSQNFAELKMIIESVI
ncbi:MAG: tRNA dihydrouridine synthase DusB [Fibrobacter sp.]|nr:tRNA dihydrouridine synthase DusB [Fibrobacter sp.]